MVAVFNSQSGPALQIADIGSRGAIHPQPLTPRTTDTEGVTISSEKFAASTADGVLYVADVRATDGTPSNVQTIQVGDSLKLQEVVFDPSGQVAYTADQDAGGIYGYALTSGGPPAPLAGSPFSTGSLPGGPTGMAFISRW